MNRTNLQILATLRIREAQALLRAKEYSGAYYLAGYSVECALKACIAGKFMKHDFPDKKTVLDAYTHELSKLAKLADLEPLLQMNGEQDPYFDKNWALVREWSEQARYRVIEEPESRGIINAIIERKHGVMPWIKRFW